MKRFATVLSFAALLAGCSGAGPGGEPAITHGPMLGRLGADSIGVWARTNGAGSFRVFYGEAADRLDRVAGPVETSAEDDFTGWIEIDGLKPRTVYYYAVAAGERPSNEPLLRGHFHTLADSASMANPEYNPRGLFNVRFEFGCGNHQGVGRGPELPAFGTMLDRLTRPDGPNEIDFAVLNGDWLYESDREFSAAQWRERQALDEAAQPRALSLMPWVAGVWENYKVYLERAPRLAAWHRTVPSYYTFDDHEILNDVYGAGEVGRRNSKAVFRDVALSGWYDYLGWSNEVPPTQDILVGQARLEAGSDVLTDPSADFSRLKLDESLTLHVHWGSDEGAKVQDAPDETGDPNANVYEIVEVLDANRLRIRPAAAAASEPVYSIGRVSYWKKRIANVDIFFLDTRSQRQMHDLKDPFNPKRSMLGRRQTEWLKREMAVSDADFSFVFSSVNFVIPHVGANSAGREEVADKDEAWTVFRAERKELIDLWDSLGKPVFVLTGDLHNSFAIRVTDNVWEFASGPHNSGQHPLSSEGGRPPNGLFDYQGQPVEIRWSSFALPDTPNEFRHRLVYCVVLVNNVWQGQKEPGVERWVAYPRPQVVFQYYDGFTGELLYAESILARP